MRRLLSLVLRLRRGIGKKAQTPRISQVYPSITCHIHVSCASTFLSQWMCSVQCPSQAAQHYRHRHFQENRKSGHIPFHAHHLDPISNISAVPGFIPIRETCGHEIDVASVSVMVFPVFNFFHAHPWCTTTNLATNPPPVFNVSDTVHNSAPTV